MLFVMCISALQPDEVTVCLTSVWQQWRRPPWRWRVNTCGRSRCSVQAEAASWQRHETPSAIWKGARRQETLPHKKKAKTQAEGGDDKRSNDLEETTALSSRLHTGFVTSFPKNDRIRIAATSCNHPNPSDAHKCVCVQVRLSRCFSATTGSKLEPLAVKVLTDWL